MIKRGLFDYIVKKKKTAEDRYADRILNDVKFYKIVNKYN